MEENSFIMKRFYLTIGEKGKKGELFLYKVLKKGFTMVENSFIMKRFYLSIYR